MQSYKKPNIIPVSFKNNYQDQLLLSWAYENGQIIGISAYIKKLILEDMEKQKLKDLK